MKKVVVLAMILISLSLATAYQTNIDGIDGVDLFDLVMVARNMGDPNYHPSTDVDGNNNVNLMDLIIVARDLGKDEPPVPPPSPQPGDEFNPPFPRTIYQVPGGTARPHHSDGATALIWSRFDMLAFAGDVQWNPKLVEEIKSYRSVPVLGTSIQGVWPGRDPAECFVLRSGAAHLTRATGVGDTEIYIDSIAPLLKVDPGQPERYMYAVIDNRDIISYTSYQQVGSEFKLTGVPSSGELAVGSHSSGKKSKAIIRFPGFGMLQDLTSFAPLLPDGRECWEYFIDNRFEWTDFSYYDGVFYDAYREAFWSSDFSDDIDLDRNDLNDIDEHGIEWVNQQWNEGIINTINYEKQRFAAVNPDKPIIYVVNTGNGADSYLKEYINGVYWEGFMRFAWNWNHVVESMQTWMEALEQRGEPLIYIIEDYVKESDQMDGKNDFQYMRYGLTTTLMGDGYYGRTFGDYYYISLWYDEFETSLGYPRSEALRLDNHCSKHGDQQEFCVHVRFFDEGVVISNPTTVNQVVTDNDLKQFSQYYDGPYHRFRGGQDPDMNNGQQFNQVELRGEPGAREKHNRGDGIILLKQPYTIISDITIGNYQNSDTSPGSDKAEFHGSWEPMTSRGDVEPQNPYYSQWNTEYCPWNVCEGYGYFIASAGNGDSFAIYRPTIGVAGCYNVYEWHGWHGDTAASYQEATDVPYEIHHSSGVKTGTINQQLNYGQWNLLGTYYFSKGTQGYVKISNQANGYVIADAFRFEYSGECP